MVATMQEKERESSAIPFFLASIRRNHQKNPLAHVLLVHTPACIYPFRTEVVIPVLKRHHGIILGFIVLLAIVPLFRPQVSVHSCT